MVDNGEICIEVRRINSCITWIGFGFLSLVLVCDWLTKLMR